MGCNRRSVAKPAVVTATGGVPDLVSDGETGIVVEVGNPVALADGLCRMLADPDQAASLGRQAQRRYQMVYDPCVLTRRLEDLFAGVAGKYSAEIESRSSHGSGKQGVLIPIR